MMQVMPLCAPASGVRGSDATSGSAVSTPACPEGDVGRPPPECYSTSFVVEAANDGAVGQSYSSAYPLHDVAMVTSSVMFGDAEGSPARRMGRAQRTTRSPTSKRSGRTVSSTRWRRRRAGRPSRTTAADGDATITALDGSGAVLATLPATADSYVQTPAECIPPPPAPPALPPAGAEQPDDACRRAAGDHRHLPDRVHPRQRSDDERDAHRGSATASSRRRRRRSRTSPRRSTR